MEIDNYLNSLNADLERQMEELNRSISGTLNMGRDSISDSVVTNNAEFIFCSECGTRIAANSKFCPECGTPVAMVAADNATEADNPINDNRDYIMGILFTDTMALAEKYGVERWEAVEMFNGICQTEQEYGRKWMMLDAAEYRPQLGRDSFWLDYNELLSDFMEENHYKYGMKTPVFIIGGDDVIPIPMVEDLFGTSDSGHMPCDMCYCFGGNFFDDLWNGDRTITEDYVRNNVSRLPLEDGKMETSMGEDILRYFERCRDYYDYDIPSDYVMMTSNSSWLPASKTMSEHLPLINHADDEDMVEDNMYVSPPVAPDNKEAVETVSVSMEGADMLLFNLHGAGQEGMSSFYSDEGEAFNTEMLQYTNARVFNTVACYGARYHGFDRDDSMLLTSLYNHGFLLYCGSLIPVPMTKLDVPDGVEVHEGSGSEHLMPIYCMEQYTGLPAGEAMMKAKLEYFNTFRHLERDDFSMATMQMFSLYGNPMLRIQRNEEVLQRAKEEHVLPVLPQSKALLPVRMKRMQRIMTKGNSTSSLLADIRGAVNTNLDAMHAAIAENLYAQLGLEPRMLDHIDSYSIPNGDGSTEKGYMYAYINEDRAFANKAWVEMSEGGNVKRIIKTK